MARIMQCNTRKRAK